MLPSASRIAPSKDSGGCRAQTRSRDPLMVSIRGEDVGLVEAAAEVAGGGRVGDAVGPERIEVDLIVAAQFEMFDATAAGEEIEGDVQDVVGFVVGQHGV